MPRLTSLDELISRRASEFADHVRQAARLADKEEEIRIEVEKQLAFIQREASVKLEGKHEFTVASGRADSVYDRVVIEYKNPSSPGSRIGDTLDAPGTRKVVEQLKQRFRDLQTELGHPIHSLFGVGCDGNRFVFVRWRDKKWDVQPPVEVDKHSAERFLWALFNLGTRGKPFKPEYLAGDFGSDAPLAQAGVKALYDAICAAEHPKARTFFNQWKILFGEVCGYEVDDPSEKIKKLAKFYAVTGKLHPAELLFALQTYYALFMKLLASTVVASFHNLPTPLAKLIMASAKSKFRAEMEDLEKGSIFRHLNITNFLEGDLFAWYLPVWDDDVEKLLRALVRKLDEYNPRTLAEDPAGSRDLLKKLYQELFPKSVRHDLGEYYTPDWLAEHVLNEVGYDGDPDKRVLDPACGSGTFLVMAINRIRKWYDNNRDRCDYEEDELCRKILSNVIGFDLNPLAIMASRTNYLIAIRDLIGRAAAVELPVYVCDSITTPANVGGVLFEGVSATVKQLPSAVGPFEVPVEVTGDRAVLGRYVEVLENVISTDGSVSTFEHRCRDEGLPYHEVEAHNLLFRRLATLKLEQRNGVWARIIKNAFAPVFVGRGADYVVGNPPWVNYENLPGEYREASGRVWDKYGLFPRGGWRARFAKGNTELAMIFLFACMDNYVRRGGRLGFVITQSVFQSKDSGRGFRTFSLGEDKPIRVFHIDDLTSFQPFEGAVNRTAVVVADLAGTTQYPVSYTVWRKSEDFCADEPLPVVLKRIRRTKCFAAPVGDVQSPWMIVSEPGAFVALKKLSRGSSGYRAWKGADTRGGNGVFWLQFLKHTRAGIYCRNTPEYSKKKPPEKEWAFEPDLIWPMLRGRETSRWSARPTLCLLFPHQANRAIPADELQTHYPRTWGYLKEMEQHLRRRRMYDLSRRKLPFYSLFETGPFLMAPYKVVWKYIASSLTCAVVARHDLDGLSNRVVIPDHKLVIVPLNHEAEAHYLCAALNSAVARLLAKAYVVGTQISTHILEFIKVPPFDPTDDLHTRLSELSRECHKLVQQEDVVRLGRSEALVDETASELWKLTRQESKSVRSMQASASHSLDEMEGTD